MFDRSVLGVFAGRAGRRRAPAVQSPPQVAAEDPQEELLWLALQHRRAMCEGSIRRSAGRRLADDIIVARLLRRA